MAQRIHSGIKTTAGSLNTYSLTTRYAADKQGVIVTHFGIKSYGTRRGKETAVAEIVTGTLIVNHEGAETGHHYTIVVHK